MFQFTYKLRVASGSKPSVTAIPATTPSVTGEEASREDARPVFLYTTCIMQGSCSTLLTEIF